MNVEDCRTSPLLVDLHVLGNDQLFGTQITVEVLRGDHKEKIPVLLEPKPDES